MSAFLELREVSKVFGGGLFQKRRTVALDRFSMTIDTAVPSVRAVAGESGSGKSTLGLLLLDFLAPTSGQVLYQGKDLRKLTSAERMQFRREVQAVFQDPFSVYNPFYPVDHVLQVPIEKFKLAKSNRQAKQLIEEALAGVGLRAEETLGRYPHQLSGGQRQRIMVARALLTKPRLIIADEPVSMVDASLRATILESLRRLNREFGISILYITHDLTTAYHVSNDILVLYKGSVAESGDVEHVIKAPKHPYTQLLVNSIPWPDLNRQWGDIESKTSRGSAKVATKTGCKFADRCPHVMAVCSTQPPTAVSIQPGQTAACYLYTTNPG
ncbi:MAG: ABC transporter ATP-binding protein [Caldilineaceae bacterium]|nr:ABC transporter ATP-binding protein [Caldilineaceae bacterium]